MEVLTIELFPSSESHSVPFLGEFDWSKVSFEGLNMAFSCASLPSIDMIYKL